jgi:large subunit ribosomal protein L9
MDVILLKDVEKVGLRGDVVSVTRGYMRNYLGPRKLAEEATPARVAEMEKRESQRARHEAQSFEDAQKIADALGKAELRFDVNAGPQGTLFGSVTATDVADEIWEKLKIRVDRRKIDLADPIKRIGRYSIPIEVFTDVSTGVRTLVVPEGGELPPEEELEAMEAAVKAAETEDAEAAAAQQADVEAEVERYEAEEAAAEVEEEALEEAEVEAVAAETEEQLVEPAEPPAEAS